MTARVVTSRVALVNGEIMVPGGPERSAVMIADGRIAAIGAVPANWNGAVIDADGLIIAPGLIDLQVNGGLGSDLTSDPEAMWELGRLLPGYGVTTFLPTVISSFPAAIRAAQAALTKRPIDFCGAEPLGLHLEGPMLNPSRAGAHDPTHLVAPSLGLIAGWSPETGIAMVTIAPELPGALEVIRELVSRGVVAAAGHSDATVHDAARAAAAGVSHVTHLYNAMSPLRHRRPGLVGFTLGRPDVTAGIIADGCHVAPAAVAAAWRAKGPGGLALVTDAGAALGMPPGTYTLGRHEVDANGASVRRRDGTLAGTNLTMPEAMRNLVAFTDCAPCEAIEAATTTPARIVALGTKGRLTVGADADIVILDDDFEVIVTLIGGRVVHYRDHLA